MEFQSGDVVQLKSGGPQLTVRAIEGGDVTVNWFDKTTARTATFKDVQLQPHEGDKPYLIVMGGVDLSKSVKNDA